MARGVRRGVEKPQEFYPGDIVKIVTDIKVKEIENAKGMQGLVTHYEFDDGYESCQTCSTSRPVVVLLDKQSVAVTCGDGKYLSEP